MKFELWESKDGWRWRLFSGSRMVAESGEAYATKSNAKRALTRFRQFFSTHDALEIPVWNG